MRCGSYLVTFRLGPRGRAQMRVKIDMSVHLLEPMKHLWNRNFVSRYWHAGPLRGFGIFRNEDPPRYSILMVWCRSIPDLVKAVRSSRTSFWRKSRDFVRTLKFIWVRVFRVIFVSQAHVPETQADELRLSPSNGARAVPYFALLCGCRYSLVGFISHIGKNTSCGHYVAHIRKDGRWAIFDDRKVTNDNRWLMPDA